MQKSQINFAYIFIALMSLVCARGVFGTLSITQLQITESTFSVTFSGNLPAASSPSAADSIFAVNSDANPSAEFVTVTSEGSSSPFFSGDQTLDFSVALGEIAIGRSAVGLYFIEDFATGDELDGTVTLTWDSAVFDPSAVDSLDFYWGGDPEIPSQNVLLGNVSVVPEPSAAALLLGMGAVFLVATRREVKA